MEKEKPKTSNSKHQTSVNIQTPSFKSRAGATQVLWNLVLDASLKFEVWSLKF
jgi:hypothetical protein